MPLSLIAFQSSRGLRRMTLQPLAYLMSWYVRFLLLFFCLSGMATWAVAIPPDVIKSRWQTAAEGTYSGLGDVLR